MWIVTYDISDDGTRAKVARCLESWGERVLWSVFEVQATPYEADQLWTEVQGLVDDEVDKIRMYRQCRGCTGETTVLGQPGPRAPVDEHWVV